MNTLLGEMVENYGNSKKKLDEIKKETDGLNKDIKEIMSTEGLKDCSSEHFTAKYTLVTSEKLDEEKLLSFMHEHSEFGDAIKTREFIDMETLENMIYNGKIPSELIAEISKFKEKSSIARLTIKENKKW